MTARDAKPWQYKAVHKAGFLVGWLCGWLCGTLRGLIERPRRDDAR